MSYSKRMRREKWYAEQRHKAAMNEVEEDVLDLIKPLDKMNVRELDAFAAAHDIPLDVAMKKPDKLAAIMAAMQNRDDGNGNGTGDDEHADDESGRDDDNAGAGADESPTMADKENDTQ